MSALPKHRMTVEEFLRWSQGQEGRYELVDGEVCAQAAERVIHSRVKGDVYAAFRDAIRARGAPCHALSDGVAVRIDAHTVYEPDAMIYCGPQLAPNAMIVETPMIVAEVLSPSTGHNDTGAKLEGYFRLPSLVHYLIVDPARRCVVQHSRGEGGALLTRIIRDGVVTLDPPGLTLALDDVYGPAEG